MKNFFYLLKVIAPERAQGALDIKTELESALESFLKEANDLHKGRIQYLLNKVYTSSSPEVYAEALLEHVQFLKKGGNYGS